MGTPNPDLAADLANAVHLVNAHSGQAAVCLRFASGEADELDFIANSAAMQGDQFEFTAGIETYTGRVAELAEVRAEVIQH
ncbi:MAG: hypothetical protein PVJ57_19265 [Phycisphaerae bacterium]